MQAANFCFPETHSESQGAPLKIGRMRCSPSPNHNGKSKMHAGLGGRGVCVSVCVCVFVGGGGGGGDGGGLFHCGMMLFPNHVILLIWCCYQHDF